MREKSLTIKCFHINKVEFSDKTYIKDNVLYIRKNLVNEKIFCNDEFIKDINIEIIPKEKRDIEINSILDFYPIATKALGKIGEGITYVLTGVIVMITGVEYKGPQIGEFGSSEGILNKQVKFNKRGTPNEEDFIIHIDIVLKEGMGVKRAAITRMHKASDLIIDEIRDYLKHLNGSLCDERHDYVDKVNKKGKKVFIVKQVAGQGAMYDTALFPKEPCSSLDSRSIIDMGNVPIVLTPNEYRDGAIRAMY
ncbi:D-proline reductase (dithiol) PrdD [Eubacterium multiforme]|uniref:D-proline reductase (Dithiol) PrdD n=1 Tax=Eubacterium multiforme TaxID=83339 RepID=A0ABT9USA7_9FIRM|nr:D-proline reductase (dithiol) PrdD [Eubacterium multiforme]